MTLNKKPLSFKKFLAKNEPIVNFENSVTKNTVVAMDLDSKNPATYRLTQHSAIRVIRQHQQEIQALADK